MRSIFVVLVSSLFVVFVLFVLVSEDPRPPGGSLTLHTERLSDLGEGLLKTFLVQRQRESGGSNNPTTIAKAQQRLEKAGFYSGPLDGVMNQHTHDALRSFQESKRLKTTGEIDRDTARELRLQE